MPIIDLAVSVVENYIQYTEIMKVEALTLNSLLERSSVNQNGRMGSEEAIDRQAAKVLACVEAIEILGKRLRF